MMWCFPVLLRASTNIQQQLKNQHTWWIVRSNVFHITVKPSIFYSSNFIVTHLSNYSCKICCKFFRKLCFKFYCRHKMLIKLAVQWSFVFIKCRIFSMKIDQVCKHYIQQCYRFKKFPNIRKILFPMRCLQKQ